MAAVLQLVLQSAEQCWALDVRLGETREDEDLSDREAVELRIATCEKYAKEDGLAVRPAHRRQWPAWLGRDSRMRGLLGDARLAGADAVIGILVCGYRRHTLTENASGLREASR